MVQLTNTSQYGAIRPALLGAHAARQTRIETLPHRDFFGLQGLHGTTAGGPDVKIL